MDLEFQSCVNHHHCGMQGRNCNLLRRNTCSSQETTINKAQAAFTTLLHCSCIINAPGSPLTQLPSWGPPTHAPSTRLTWLCTCTIKGMNQSLAASTHHHLRLCLLIVKQTATICLHSMSGTVGCQHCPNMHHHN